MNLKEFINVIDDNFQIARQNIKIILTANVRGKRTLDDYFEFDEADISEQFSEEEYFEIRNGIADAGFFIENEYFNELDLIKNIVNEQYNYSHYIVYNLIRNGYLYARKSLMPAFLEFIHFPYTCSNSLTVSLCRNKYYVTKMLEVHNIRVPKTYLFDNKSQFDFSQIDFPIIVKDIMGAASTGLSSKSILYPSIHMEEQIKEIFKSLNQSLVIQELIEGYECEVPIFIYKNEIVMADAVGLAIRGKKKVEKEILTYERSYNYDYDFFLMKDEVSEYTLNQIYCMAKQAAEILGIKIYGRIDFRIGYDGIPYIIDVSTTPYTINHSSFAYVFKENGLSYEKIYQAVIVNTFLTKCQDSQN